MTWYPDLSPYIYLQEHRERHGLEHIPAGQVILNVGWLESGHDFPVGDPPPGFVDALAELCIGHPQALTRGWQNCLFCTDEEYEYPSTFNIDGEKHGIGHGEVRVISKGGPTLSAPDLVLHYVDRHRYLPPAEFIEAVLARRIAPALEA
jgi:hypothetical protein